MMIQAIRLLPEIERSFIPYPASSSQHSSSNMSDPAATSSKPAAVPSPNPRTHASTSKKRKGSETTTLASEGFSCEELSFTESLEPMTSFLNKLKKVTQDAEVKLAAAHVEHEQAMISFREGIKNSTVVSLLQARIKMAYEAKETCLECPS
ncbi:hypothetical protein Hanom_Chr12g01119581 [Helianthus anomalus]